MTLLHIRYSRVISIWIDVNLHVLKYAKTVRYRVRIHPYIAFNRVFSKENILARPDLMNCVV